MRRRTARTRTNPLAVTRLEDRTVPTVGEAPLVVLPPQHYLTGENSSFLTGPQAGDYQALAKQALTAQAAALGLTPGDVAAPVTTDAYSDAADGGSSHVYFRQQLNGLPVLNANIGVHLTAAGEVITVNGGFVPGLAAQDTGTPPAPALSAVQAVSAAAAYFNLTLTSDPTVVSTEPGVARKTIVSSAEASSDPIPVDLTYTTSTAGVKLAWEVVLFTPTADAHWYQAAVDAATGEVVFWADWVEHLSAGYQVIALPQESPIVGAPSDSRQVLVGPADPTASPLGWHDTSVTKFTDTRGNNVFAQDDVDQDNARGKRPSGGDALFFSSPLDLTRGPDAYLAAATTNLFYMNNVLHDVHYKYGFNERSGNFQVTNFTGQGQGKDQVLADAQDGRDRPASGNTRDNAYFATPPDGTSGRMAMFVFDLTTPDRDGDLENGVIAHEFGHGVSSRLTGGPSLASGLQALQSGGMGEGWSDFYSLMFTQSAASTQNGRYPVGNWVLGQPASGGGIRRNPYSYDLAVNPITFDAYAGSPEAHDAGEIWASTLWDLNWLLINKYGYDQDLLTGYTAAKDPGNGPAGAGNKLALRLVMEGMKAQPANPSFIQARDALLSADFALTGGLATREIWTAFARRGLGFSAKEGTKGGSGANAQDLTTAYDMPPLGSTPAVIGETPFGDSAAPAGTVTIRFSEPMDPTTFDPAADITRFTGPDGQDLKGAVTATTWNAANTALTVTFAPPADPQGKYTLVLSPFIKSADAAKEDLNGNFDKFPGGNADGFTARWGVDAAPLTVTAVAAVNGGSLISGEDSILVTFSEPVAPASLSVDDLQVTNGTVAAFVQVDGNKVRYDLTGLTAGPLYYSLKYGAVTDAYGFGSVTRNVGPAVANVRAAVPALTVVEAGPELLEEPFPAPLDRLTPGGRLPTVGWQAFGGQRTAWINTPGDTDTYTINLDAGSRVSIIVDQTATLRPVLSVVGPLGTLLDSKTAFAPGGSAVVVLDLTTLDPSRTGVAGGYRLTVGGGDGTFSTTGAYRVRVVVGAATEAEATGGQSNNSRASAQTFNLVPYEGGAVGGTVTGAVGQTLSPGVDPDDYFSVPLSAGDTLTVGLAAADAQAAGLSGPGASVALLNGSGQPVGTALAVTPSNYDGGYTFTAPAGTAANSLFYVHVTSVGGAVSAPYLVSVVKNGVVEREDNNASNVAQDLGTLPAAGLVVRGGIDGTDSDWYKITIPAQPAQPPGSPPPVLTVYTTTPNGGPFEPVNDLRPVVELWQGSSNLRADSTSGGDGRNAFFQRAVVAGQSYFLRVGANASTAGDYLLRFTTAPDAGPINAGPIPVAPAPTLTVAEGNALTLTATGIDADPTTDTLEFGWDLNGDGDFTDAVGRTPTVYWSDATLPANAPPGTKTLQSLGLDNVDLPPGQYRFPARVRVTDADNRTAVVTSTGVVITVTNTRPTGTPTPARQVEESEDVLFGLTGDGPTDTEEFSRADRTAGLHYAYDYNNDNVWDLGDGTYSNASHPDQGPITARSTSVPSTFIGDGPGAFTAKVRVIDQDGGFSDYTTTFPVVNAAPVAVLAADPAPANPFAENTAHAPLAIASLRDSDADILAGIRYSFGVLNADSTITWFFGDVSGGGTSYTRSALLPAAGLTIPPALYPDGPATLTVVGRVFDRDTLDGGGREFRRDLAVANVAPTAPVNTAPPAAGGSTAKTPEGGTARIVLQTAVEPSDGDRAALQYSYGFRAAGGAITWVVGTGVYDTTGRAGNSTAGTFDVPTQPYLDDEGTGPLTVVARVMDRNGGVNTYDYPLAVTNVPPTATPVFPDQVVVGRPLTVALTSPFDPSALDTRAGFTYSFDFNADGDFRDPGEVANSPVASLAYTFQTPGPKQVRVWITDTDGGKTPYNLTVNVDNTAPAVTAAPVAPVNEGGTATVRVTASHPSTVTTAAGFRYAYDFDGNGTWDLGDGSGYGGGVRADTATIPAAFLSDGNLSRNAVVRVMEVNGLSTDLPVPLTVRNVAPTARLVAPAGRIEVRSGAAFAVADQADASPQDQAAGFTYSWDFNNDGDYADPAEVAGSASPNAVAEFAGTGPQTVRVRVTDKDGGFTDYTTVVTVGTVTKTWYAAGVGADNAPVARLYDTNGNTVFAGLVFGPEATGGVRVVSADVNGDGTPDLVAATGPGVPAQVKVIDGKNGGTLFDVRPFGTFTGGAFVAAGDVDGDGFADVAVTPDEGGGPRVVMYSGKGFRQTASFFGIADSNFRGGARVAIADVNGDGMSDVLVAAGFGGGPRVAGFDGTTVATTRTKLFADFFAFDPALRNGVYLSGGDMTGDGRAEVVIGAGPGGGPQVLALDGAALLTNQRVEQADFFAADIQNRSGVRVSVADIDGDGRADIVTGDASGPKLLVFRGSSLKASGFPADPVELFPFSTLTNGVFVG